MRVLLFLLTAAIFLTAGVHDVQAKRGIGGGAIKEELVFVAETQIPNQNGNGMLSLCHLIKTTSALFIPIYHGSEGYGLAENRCNTEQYYPFDRDKFLAAQSLGLIADDVASEPQLSKAQALTGKFWLAAAISVVGLIIFGAIRSRRRRLYRYAEMGNASPLALKVLDAMCHAAISDGRADRNEVAAISIASEKLTGQAFTPDKIMRLIGQAETKLTDSAYRKFGNGLSARDKRIVMRGVLMVVAADGQFAGKEQAFVGKLAKGLKISGNEIKSMLAELAQSPTPPAGAAPA